VGSKNIVFVKQYLKQEGFAIAAEDTGDIFPRKVSYFPQTGAVTVRKLKTQHNNAIAERELQYRRKILNPGYSG
jgi:chemotaxis protein CheD